MTLQKQRRVVITGLGVVAPNGIGKEDFWQACISGRSGVRLVTLFDASFLPTRIAGEVVGFDPAALGLTKEEADALDRSSVRTEPWIGRHHTFDIGPDLDAIRFQHRTNDGSRVVGTATAEGGRYARFISCDESAEHRDSLLGNEWHNFLLAALSRLFH